MNTITIRVGTVTITIEQSDAAPVVRGSDDVLMSPPTCEAWVDNNDLNRGHPFWGPLIGQKVTILGKPPFVDQVDVLPPGSAIPSEGVDLARFMLR